MFFSSRSFLYAKDPEQMDSNQDALQLDEWRGRAVIADGVASAIFSADWARLLTDAILAEAPPDPSDGAVFSEWLQALRNQWFQAIDTTNLTWYQRPKLAAGAFSTLLWFQLEPCDPPVPGSPEYDWIEVLAEGRRCFRLTGWALGDSCLFHVRYNKPMTGYYDGTDLMNVFPIEHSEDFDESPMVLGSSDLGKDAFLHVTPLRRIVQEGDWLILATDAFSQWILRAYEAGLCPDWNDFWNLTPEAFGQEIEQMRAAQEIRYDDTTLAVLYVGGEPAAGTAESAETAESVETAETAESTETTYTPETVEEVTESVFDPLPQLEIPGGEPIAPESPPLVLSMPEETVPLPEKSAEKETEFWIEASAEVGNQMANGMEQFKRKGRELAQAAGERISEGMIQIGDKTHEVVQAATPKVQGMVRGFLGFFKRKPAETDEAGGNGGSKPNDATPARRPVDPNRRRFYQPPSQDNPGKTDEKEE